MAPCSIKWCGKDSCKSNFKTDGLTFHRYPQDPKLKEKWIKVTRRENWNPSKYSVICSRHFTPDCFYYMKNRRRLLSSAVPSLFLPLLSGSTAETITAPSWNPPINTLETKSGSSSPEPLISSETKTSTLQTDVKRKKIIDPSKLNTPTKKRLSRRILELSEMIVKKNRQIKNWKQRTEYLIKKTALLKSTVRKLRKKCILYAEKANKFSESYIMCCYITYMCCYITIYIPHCYISWRHKYKYFNK